MRQRPRLCRITLTLFLALACTVAHALEPVRALEGPFDVLRVIDGDTIEVDADGVPESVRLIGIDTPETGEDGEEAARARRALQVLLGSQPVWLERDVEDRDAFGRWLRYVYVPSPDGPWTWSGDTYLQANLRLVLDGRATLLTIPPSVQYAPLYEVALIAARENGVGMWAATGAERTSSRHTSEPRAVGGIAGDPPIVSIACIYFDPDTPQDRNGEFVTLIARDEVDVTGWWLEDAAHHVFRLPSTRLGPGEYIEVPNPEQGLWNNGGDTAYLYDADGKLVDELGYDGSEGREACR